MPGRKVWIWDLSRSGEIWVDLLTDKDGQYTEPQAGRLLNQSDHDDLRARLGRPLAGALVPLPRHRPDGQGLAARRPERGPRGRDAASRALPAPARRRRPRRERRRPRRSIRERVVLAPEQIWKKDVALAGAAAEAPLEVRLGAKLIYESAPEADDLERPLRFSTPSGASAEALFLQAGVLERERRLTEALEKYLAVVGEEPLHVRALTRAAELFTRRGEPARALELAGRALAVSMYDAEANYVYGVAARRLGRLVDAKETLGWAARSPQFEAVALVQSAEIALLEKNFDRASEYAIRALVADDLNVDALEVLAVSHRLAGRKAEHGRVLGWLLEIDPLNHLARFERYLLGPRARDPRGLPRPRPQRAPARDLHRDGRLL